MSLARLAELLTWRDVVDVLAVALVIYNLLLLIRGTRAVQILLGLSFVAFVYWLARLFELPTLEKILESLLIVLPFAVIVLFQSDIRRALAHFGRAPFVRHLTKTIEGEEDIVEELVVSCTSLAARRIGAIVVIEREIGLRNYIEGGIPLDATVTYDLLASIFQPGSPLHDGAVIIQGERIAAAACFLPLSVNPLLSKDLGTRHRAALGLTEENDAMAVVVSEETGVISIVIGGGIERHVTADRLRVRLHELLGPRRTAAERKDSRSALT